MKLLKLLFVVLNVVVMARGCGKKNKFSVEGSIKGLH